MLRSPNESPGNEEYSSKGSLLRISIKYKFLIPAVFLLIAGMGIVSVVSHIKAKNALTKVIVDEIENMTHTTALSMSSWIDHRKIDIGNWSKQGVYKKALLNSFLGLTARTFANEQLKQIKQDYGFYDDIVVANLSGEIVANSDPDVVGKFNVGDREYFINALKGDIYVSNQIFKSRARGNSIFMISAPVKDKEKVVGVLFAVFDLNTLVKKFVDPIRIGKTGYAYMFLNDGLIVSNREDLKKYGRNIKDFCFGQTMLQIQNGLLECELNGKEMIASFKKLPRINGTIVVTAFKDEIFFSIKNLGRLNGMFTVVVALIVGLVIFIITNSLSRPIQEVVSGLKKMGAGHLNFRLNIKNRDEIGEIGHALNGMAQNLEISDLRIKRQNILLEKAKDDLELRVDQRTSELRIAEQKYRGIFENAVEGIFQTTLDGVILNANPSFSKILGYNSVEEMFAGKKEKKFPVSKKDSLKITHLLETEGRIVAYETRLLKKDGSWFWSSISVNKIHDEGSPGDYYEGFVIDITEGREKQKAQREWKAAKAANNAKSEFIANMSHEIRTPLNVLLGFSELLSVDLNDPKQESYIVAMRAAGKSLLTLINDILDLSKIEADKIVFNYEPVNLKLLFLEIEFIFKDKICNKGISLAVDIASDIPPLLNLDESRARQILLNLVGNAVKFTEKGSIKLTAEKKENQTLNMIDLIIKVEDTGLGIEKNQLHSIFESFKQADGQINRRYGGTGLGLAICKRLTEAMGGQIGVTSQKDVGSTFTICLKNVSILSDETRTVEKQSPGTQSGLPCFEKKKILIVDDIESNRFMLKELLIRFNQDVLEACNGQEALTMARENKPDIIIMDIRMPELDGNQVTEILKSAPDTKNIPIIAFTGDVVAKTKTSAFEKGYDSYITKPVKIGELINELYKYIGEAHFDKQKKKQAQSLHTIVRSDVLNPSDLIIKLKNEILPSCLLHKNSMIIGQIKDFSITLQQLADKHHVPQLAAFSDDLTGYADLFDITNIEKKMNDLPKIIENLIERLIQKP
ncbi:MAG: response regulator [Desulfobacterium sp.]|nr:response regulator [Desulfobacterium sp.]